MKYVALLRGINVGGNKKVPMAELKKLLTSKGLKNVKTVLASGNVVFEGEKISDQVIGDWIATHFGFSVETQIIPFSEILDLQSRKPFKGIDVHEKTRLYVTFCRDKHLQFNDLPYISADGAYQLLDYQNGMAISVLDLDKMGSVDHMKILEDRFGKSITTRNYNTIEKILAL